MGLKKHAKHVKKKIDMLFCVWLTHGLMPWATPSLKKI